MTQLLGADDKRASIQRQTTALLFAVVVSLSPALHAGGGASLQFTEVGADRGILPFDLGSFSMMGAGIAAADYDDDGDIDRRCYRWSRWLRPSA